ncbi:hypothetical protein [Desulfobacterium sp. N47]|uniref:Uncharacterized protein n=1 Tax=uncultured Desulfobacterium sp. TaxID=201089 RepID=E1YID9_9BACT|nr:hypothetical protein N47_D27950 [uncultured Desulfobacterium sp.]
MKKYFKIVVLALSVIGLVCGSAFAAATLNAGNTTIASELVPAAGLALTTVNTGYQPNGSVAATSQLKISLTNGTFGATVVSICDNAGGTYGGAVPVPGSTSVTITTTQAMASGTVYNLQPAAVCAAGPVALTQVSIGAGAVAGTVVSMSVDNALSPGDTNVYATAPIITLMDQFSVEMTPVRSTITFASGMKQLNGIATSAFDYNIISNESIATKIPTGLPDNVSCGVMGAGTGSFAYSVTPGTGGSFSGIAPTTGFGYTIAGGGFTVIDAAIAATDATAAGNAATPGFMVCGSSTPANTKALSANQLILTVDGTTVLTPRTYAIGISTVTGAPIVAGARTLIPSTTLGWTWVIDSTQYYVPLVGSNASTGRETYIKLQSKNTSSAANGVIVAILANDGSTVATWTGTITPGTPLTVTGSDLVTAAATAGKTVDGAAGFAVIVTVNAPEADVFAYANMLDASGAKRIPVKTVAGLIVE